MPDQPESIRSMMKPIGGSRKDQLGEPLITINPRDIDAQTRVPAVFTMATLAMMAKWVSKDPTTNYPERGKDQFNAKTLSGIMDIWEYEYKKKAISLDGKARDEYVKVASFIAVGADESGTAVTNLLEEGSKKLNQKDQKK
ncbi:MAG: hypothetical protein KGI38_12495 [Thaumarchaeota archaeon]|nr:hypothetical protein [Nitrososphaerota archaeon]